MIWTSPYFILACVLLYLVVTLWIVSRWHLRETTEEDYYVAGRNVGYIPNSLSIVAALMSGGIYLGTVGLFYLNRVGFLAFGFAYIFTLYPLWWIGKRLWPLAKTFQYTTPQDFYGHFYQSHLLRLLGATGSIVFLIPYMASNAVAMGTILERFTNVPYAWGVVILLTVGVGYTLYGGMRSVIYTDVFQGVISLGFGLAAVITFLYLAGGYQRMVDALPTHMLVFSNDWASYGAFLGWFVFIAANPLTMSDRMTRMLYHPRSQRIPSECRADGWHPAGHGDDFRVSGSRLLLLRRTGPGNGSSHSGRHCRTGSLVDGLACGRSLGQRVVHA